MAIEIQKITDKECRINISQAALPFDEFDQLLLKNTIKIVDNEILYTAEWYDKLANITFPFKLIIEDDNHVIYKNANYHGETVRLPLNKCIIVTTKVHPQIKEYDYINEEFVNISIENCFKISFDVSEAKILSILILY